MFWDAAETHTWNVAHIREAAQDFTLSVLWLCFYFMLSPQISLLVDLSWSGVIRLHCVCQVRCLLNRTSVVFE